MDVFNRKFDVCVFTEYLQIHRTATIESINDMANNSAVVTSKFQKNPSAMHIKDKLAEAQRSGKPIFSFEFFPPKTNQVYILSTSFYDQETDIS